MSQIKMTEEEFEKKIGFGKVFALANKRFNPDDESINQQCHLTYEIIKEELVKLGVITLSPEDQILQGAEEIGKYWEQHYGHLLTNGDIDNLLKSIQILKARCNK
jgi:hypothetical protein